MNGGTTFDVVQVYIISFDLMVRQTKLECNFLETVRTDGVGNDARDCECVLFELIEESSLNENIFHSRQPRS